MTIAADDDFGLAIAPPRLQGLDRRLGARRARRSSPSGPPEPGPRPDAPPRRSSASRLTYLWNLEPLKLPPGAMHHLPRRRPRPRQPARAPTWARAASCRLRIVTAEQLARQLDGPAARHPRGDRPRPDHAEAGHRPGPATPTAPWSRSATSTPPAATSSRTPSPSSGRSPTASPARTTASRPRSASYLDDLANLKIDNPDAQAQMQDILRGVERLRKENLGPAEQDLTRASKALDNQPPGDNANPAPQRPDQGSGRAAEVRRSPEGLGRTIEARRIVQIRRSGQGRSGESKAGDQAKGGDQPKSGQSSKDSAAQSKSGESSKGGDQPKSGEAAEGLGRQSKSGESPKSGEPSKSGEPKAKAQAQPGEMAQADATASEEPGVEGRAGPGREEPEGDRRRTATDARPASASSRPIAGVVQDAKNLLKEQEDAMKAAAEAARKPDIAGKPADALTPEQKADLANRRRTPEGRGPGTSPDLENKMDEMAKRLEAQDPASAAALKDAAQQSRERGTVGQDGARPPQGWNRTRWARPRPTRSRPSRTSRSSSTTSRTAARTSWPASSRS